MCNCALGWEGSMCEDGKGVFSQHIFRSSSIYYSQLCLSQFRFSQIIALVEGVYKSSFLYFLLFLTPHEMNFLKIKAISSVPMDST